MTAATSQYRAESDRLAGFVEDCLIRGAGTWESTPALLGAYRTWCERNHEREASPKALAERFKLLGLEPYRSHGQRYWRGVELRAEWREGVRNRPSGENVEEGEI